MYHIFLSLISKLFYIFKQILFSKICVTKLDLIIILYYMGGIFMASWLETISIFVFHFILYIQTLTLLFITEHSVVDPGNISCNFRTHLDLKKIRGPNIIFVQLSSVLMLRIHSVYLCVMPYLKINILIYTYNICLYLLLMDFHVFLCIPLSLYI